MLPVHFSFNTEKQGFFYFLKRCFTSFLNSSTENKLCLAILVIKDANLQFFAFPPFPFHEGASTSRIQLSAEKFLNRGSWDKSFPCPRKHDFWGNRNCNHQARLTFCFVWFGLGLTDVANCLANRSQESLSLSPQHWDWECVSRLQHYDIGGSRE